MSLLFFGYLLILLQLNIPIAGHNIDILFDFVGYLFLAKAAAQLAEESAFLKKTILPCKVMVPVSLVITICLTLGLLSGVPAVASVLRLLPKLAVIGILYYQIKGVSEIEAKNNYLMKCHKLRRDWMILAVAMIAGSISVYQTIAVVAAYAELIFTVMFMLDLNFAIKNYNGKVLAPTKEEQETAAAEAKAAEPQIVFTAEESDEENA